MNRRTFLVRIGGTLVAVPFVLEAVGCGDDDPAQPQQTDRFSSPSTSDGTPTHSHSIEFLCSQITAGQLVYTSRVDSTGHEHTVTLVLSELQAIAAGQSVGPKTSSVISSHDHQWTIQKPSTSC